MSKQKKQALVAAESSELPTVVLVGSAVDSFVRDLSPALATDIRDHIKAIQASQRAMVENAMAIADRLIKIRTAVGEDKFSVFVKDVCPRMGISKTTAYKYMGKFREFQVQFPNPAVRIALMTVGDGQGLIGFAEKDGKTDWSKPALTPSAEKALKALPMPKGTLDTDKAEEYAHQFYALVRKNRGGRANAKGNRLGRDSETLIDRFCRFIANHGTENGENLTGLFDKVLSEADSNGLTEYKEIRKVAKDLRKSSYAQKKQATVAAKAS